MKTSNSWRQAVQCRNRAEMLRTMANETPRAETKEALKCAAESYEAQAAFLEEDARGMTVQHQTASNASAL